MKPILLMAALMLIACCGFVTVVAQDMGDDEPTCGGGDTGAADEACGGDAENDASTEAWKKLHAPNENHAMLAKMVGKWDMEVKMWMAPNTDPTVTKTTCEFTKDFGGRFIRCKYEFKETNFPHKGELLYGYNNATKKFQLIRITDMDTGMLIFNGDHDAKTNKTTYSAKYKMDWGGETMDVETRQIYTYTSDDKFVMEVISDYTSKQGTMKDVKEVEITYTRQK